MKDKDLAEALKSIIEKELKIFSALIPKDAFKNIEENISPQIEKIVKGIKKILRKGHVGLIETLAEDISKMCLVDNRVYIAKIRIEKLEVFKESKSAGIEIERRSKNLILNVNKTIAFGSVPSSEKP